jgi:4-hydroxy-tetrahydrodipicolinate synthase
MQGVWTAITTPFTENNDLDLPTFRRQLRAQVDGGIHGIVVCGTTGESPTLSTAEKETLIQITLDELRGTSVRVMAGTGTNNTAESVRLSRWASERGVAGVLLVTPYYNRPSPAGLECHFRAIAEAIDCEITLYNVPSRTGVNFTPETILNLAIHPKIRTIKEATGNVSFTSEILDQASLRQISIDILAGDDATFFPLLCVGAVGVISVISNLFPKEMVAIYEAVQAGRMAEAQDLHRRLYPLFRDLFIERKPVPVKWALANAGFGRADTRKPLVSLTSANQRILENTLRHVAIPQTYPPTP